MHQNKNLFLPIYSQLSQNGQWAWAKMGAPPPPDTGLQGQHTGLQELQTCRSSGTPYRSGLQGLHTDLYIVLKTYIVHAVPEDNV